MITPINVLVRISAWRDAMNEKEKFVFYAKPDVFVKFL